MALNKKYSVAAATLPYVLLCYAFFILSPQIIGGETFVLIPTAMLFLGSALYAAGLYFYLKADKKYSCTQARHTVRRGRWFPVYCS